MTGIFAERAPVYSALGLEPRPVPPGGKACKIKGWQKPDTLIDRDQRERWLTRHADSGIGLRLGTILADDSRLGALDIDRDDMVRLAQALLGSTCERIGSKGSALFFRYVGQLKRKPIRRRVANGEDIPIGDLLVDGAFCVIPPTVHPSTGTAYFWVGDPLETYVLDALPLLGSGSDLQSANFQGARSLELVLAALQSEHVASLVLGQSTHDAALGFINDLLPYTQDIEFIRGLVAAALPPDYGGNTLDEVPELVASGVSKGLHRPGRDGAGGYDPRDMGPIPFGYLANGDFVLYDQRKRILVPESSNGLISLGTLMNYAPLSFWMSRFPQYKDGSPSGVNTFGAGDALIELCRKRGGFDPSLVRGRGVFPDPQGGVIVNWGGPIPEDTRYVYVCHRPLDVSTPSQPVDPRRILAMFGRFNWGNTSSALLLLGWAAGLPPRGDPSSMLVHGVF